MMATSRWIVAALVALGAAAAGCSDSSTPASDGGASRGDEAAPNETGTGTGTGSGGACAVNSDCRTYGLHCDGCSCIALPVGSVDPVCNGNQVSCLVDPCTGKTAICSAGTCTIE